VVRVGDYSRELCGGTHVRRSGELGSAYITSETGIGSGLRRVEVVAGPAALEWVAGRLEALNRVAAAIGAPPDAAAARAEALASELQALKRQSARLESAMAAARAADLVRDAESIDGLRVVVARVDASSADALSTTVDRVRELLGGGVVLLGAVIGGKPLFVASAGPDAQGAGISAGTLADKAARLTGGGGGGRPDFARAGGKDASLLDAGLERARALVEEARRA
jgi:alanyl-tRNA synthetase